jgi:peptide/nickel transport system ATP-binding protein
MANTFDNTEVVLEARGICVDYGYDDNGVQAVADVDLQLHRGEVLGLAGESGSGKSTLAYAMTRLLRPPGVVSGGDLFFNDGRPASAGGVGTVNLFDADTETLRKLRWSEIALVFQSAMNALNPVITIEAQITDILQVHRPGMSGSDRRARAGDLLKLVGINPDRLKSFPHELSGGMRQRVMIAMALALEPQIVIMDEPTTALDVVTQREILSEIIELRDRLGFAVLFITHDLSLLIEMADSIAIMYAGRLVERAPAKDLFRAPRHPYTYGLLNSFPSLHGSKERLVGIPGSPPDLRALPSGCKFNPRCSWAMPICSQKEPGLDPVASLSSTQHVAREVSCWLHRGEGRVPEQLSRPEPEVGAREPMLRRSAQIPAAGTMTKEAGNG